MACHFRSASRLTPHGIRSRESGWRPNWRSASWIAISTRSFEAIKSCWREDLDHQVRRIFTRPELRSPRSTTRASGGGVESTPSTFVTASTRVDFSSGKGFEAMVESSYSQRLVSNAVLTVTDLVKQLCVGDDHSPPIVGLDCGCSGLDVLDCTFEVI
jgi:hypothetical protein